MSHKTPFDHLTPPSLRDGHRPYILQTARIPLLIDEAKRNLMRDPLTCPKELLPILVVEYSLEEFVEDGISEKALRTLLSVAPELHRIKGTPQGIEYALNQLGIHAEFTDWFEHSPEGEPGTHEITAYVGDQLFNGETLFSPKTIRQIWRLIDEMKRWSQKTDLHIGERFKSNVFVSGATRTSYLDNAYHEVMPHVAVAKIPFGIMTQTALKIKSKMTHTIEGRAA